MAEKKEETKPPVVEAEVMDETDASALSILSRTEYDIQVATARKFPRSITKFREEARMMATLDQDTAGKMFYRLKRRSKDGEKVIEGPSIRLAEVAVAAWGHTFVSSRPVAVEDKVVRCQGFAWDLEKNNRRMFEVTRRITDSNGKRYSEDMIRMTEQAACQVAARNATFGVIPRVYIDAVLKVCKEVFVGSQTSISEKRQSCIAEFAKIGATKDQVMTIAHVKGVDDLTIDHLIDLKGLLTAIEEGATNLAEVLAAAMDDGGETTVTPSTLTPEALTKNAKVESKDDPKQEERQPSVPAAPKKVTKKEKEPDSVSVPPPVSAPAASTTTIKDEDEGMADLFRK